MSTYRMIVCSLFLAAATVARGEPACMRVLDRAGLGEERLLDVLSFCNQNLPFELRSEEAPELICVDATDCAAVLDAERACRFEIILVKQIEGSGAHQLIDHDKRIALVNVAELQSGDERVFRWRIGRMILRSAAFMLDVQPAPDPRCVTRHYTSLEDLDSMGRNFTPPYNDLLQRQAREQELAPPFSIVDEGRAKGD